MQGNYLIGMLMDRLIIVVDVISLLPMRRGYCAVQKVYCSSRHLRIGIFYLLFSSLPMQYTRLALICNCVRVKETS